MQATAIHPGNLLGLATDPGKVDRLKEPLGQVIGHAIGQSGADMDRSAVLVGRGDGERGPTLVAQVVPIDAQDPAYRPLFSTLHLVAVAIHGVVKDKPVDDETVFDEAVARTRMVLASRNVDPALAPLLAESAAAAINTQAFAEAMVMTLNPDGRLLVLKAPLLARLLFEFQQATPNA